MFESRKVYRALNGSEIKDIVAARVKSALMEDNTLNIARSFPLLKYEITVKLTPYQAAGADVKPEKDITYEVGGAIFVPVMDEAVELVETSPLYGREADPQSLRTLAEQGTVETMRMTTGELVDVRSKPGSRTEPAVEPPAVIITEPQSWPADKTPDNVVIESPEETEAIEATRWQQRKPDDAVEKAIETRDPSMAPGRVSVVRSVKEGGGSDHGHRKR